MAETGSRGSPEARQRELPAYVLLAMGMGIIAVVFTVGIVRADLLADIFGNGKAVRDGALAGSSLLADQGRVAAFQAWALPLTFLGLASFITGIGFAFWAILVEVRRRGDAALDMMVAVRGRSN